MISIIVPMNRPGGIDVLRSTLREQSHQDFELILVDELRRERHSIPSVGNGGTWHIGPGRSRRWGNYMHSLARGCDYAKGDVLLFLSDYTALHPDTLAKHAEFHATHGPLDVMMGGIEYCALPELHPDFPLRYGWGAIGYDPANHDDAKHAPWLDDKRRHELYEEWRVAYEADLASGLLDPFMHSTFATPLDGYGATLGLKVWSSNPRLPPHNFLNLKNDSFKPELLAKIGGFDERADGTHGHQDSITHRHMVKAGASFHAVPDAGVRILDAHYLAIVRRMERPDDANLKLAEALQ